LQDDLGGKRMKNIALKKHTSIKKWGNGAGILLPKIILDMLSIKANDSVEISVDEQNIIISPVRKKHLTLAERFANFEGKTKQEEFWTDDPSEKEYF